MEISFRIDDEPVQIDDLGTAVDQLVAKKIARLVRDAVGSVVCPIHAETPLVKISGSDLSSLSVDVTGCCQELIDRATKALIACME